MPLPEQADDIAGPIDDHSKGDGEVSTPHAPLGDISSGCLLVCRRAPLLVRASAPEEVNCIRRQTVWVLPRILDEGTRDPPEVVRWQRVWDDQDAVMWCVMSEPVEREANEIIAVPRDDAAPNGSRPIKLLRIRQAARVTLVGALGINPPTANDLCDTRAEILVEVVPHPRTLARSARRAAKAGKRRRTASAVMSPSRRSFPSISSG
jgi:hypothetical protein